MRYLLIVISVILICLSCKKKHNDPEEVMAPAPASPTYAVKDYMPLKYGNYWVYEITVTDTNNLVISSMIDSCYVSDSTIIRGHKFFKIDGSSPTIGYFADSAGYIIHTDGTKLLSLINNDTLSVDSQVIGPNWFNSYIIMSTTPSVFTFNSNTFSNCVKRYNYFYSNLNANCPNRILYNTYSPGLGMVYSLSAFGNTCDKWEYKLLRYKIN